MKTLQTYVDECAQIIGLRDWDITVVETQLDDDTLAECAWVYGQRRATIRIQRNWKSWGADILRSTIAHELIHCHLANTCDLIDAVLREALAPSAKKIADDAFMLSIEHAVDAISIAISTQLPWPKWADKAAKR